MTDGRQARSSANVIVTNTTDPDARGARLSGNVLLYDPNLNGDGRGARLSMNVIVQVGASPTTFAMQPGWIPMW